jgi:FkbM family methyltransferase
VSRWEEEQQIAVDQQTTGLLDETLVFDIGVNAGEDTSYYLQKGFRVVGVEANPRIFAKLQITFERAIAEGKLTLLNIGIWNRPTILPFYINLDNDHWSSFDPVYGCRDNSRFEIIEVPCIGIRTLFQQHGIPRYIKVDIEGGDKLVIADLPGLERIPPFISVEEFGNHTIPELFRAGYRKFKIIPQREKDLPLPTTIQGEGVPIEKAFSGLDSGPFGLDLAGEWLTYEQALAAFRQSVRNEAGKGIGPLHEWFDVHAAVSDEAMTPSHPVQWLWTIIRKLETTRVALTRDYEDKLSRRSTLLSETNKQLAESTARLTQSVERISDLTDQLCDARQTIGSLRQILEEAQRSNTDLERVLATTRHALDEERDARAGQEQRVRAQEQFLRDQAREIDRIRAELNSVVRSRTWRMLAPYRSIRRRLSAR